ncbi:MAG: Nif11-like leader peptide family RiPP precursor [Synergistaceae bacterium]|nr:Nif11-like leader peptide family RiPP precursor [Synergistaceae bacterium]
MSNKKELQRLIELAKEDKEFAEKFMAAMKSKNADEAIRIAAEKGVSLTADDFKFNQKRELDPEELKNVAGSESIFVNNCKKADEAFLCGIALLVDLWA